jgi:hypothetical protein
LKTLFSEPGLLVTDLGIRATPSDPTQPVRKFEWHEVHSIELRRPAMIFSLWTKDREVQLVVNQAILFSTRDEAQVDRIMHAIDVAASLRNGTRLR